MSCDVGKATEGCDVGEVTERLENEHKMSPGEPPMHVQCIQAPSLKNKPKKNIV